MIITGNRHELKNYAVNTNSAITLASHNKVYDVTATGSAVEITFPDAATLPANFFILVIRNPSSDSNVNLIGAVSETLTSDNSIREYTTDGTSWIQFNRNGLNANLESYASGTNLFARQIESYASGVESLRQSMTIGGDTTELTAYASGIETMRQAMTGTNPELESYASGTKVLVNSVQSTNTSLAASFSEHANNADAHHNTLHDIASLADHTSSATPYQLLMANISGLPVDASNTNVEVATAVTNVVLVTNYASGIESLRQSMTTGGDTSSVTAYASGINNNLINFQNNALDLSTNPTNVSIVSASPGSGNKAAPYNHQHLINLGDETGTFSESSKVIGYFGGEEPGLQKITGTGIINGIQSNFNISGINTRITTLENASGGNATKQIITHDDVFQTLNAVYCDSNKVWQKSKANVLENAEVVGVVESTSGNSSTIVMNGVITNNLITAGLVYYLSDVTDGALQTSEATNISKPVMIGIDSGVGIVQIFRSLVTSGITTNPPDVPTGTIIPYGGASAPSGYLLCDGTAYSRATYAELFAIIGVSYGNGNGSSTFNVPDLRGRSVVGAGVGSGGGRTSSGVPTGGVALTSRARGDYTGEENHVLTIAELAAHTHTTASFGWSVATSAATPKATDNTLLNSASTGSTGSDTAHNTMQPSMVTNFIIKASSQTGSVNVTYPLPRGHLAGYGTAPYTTSGIQVSAGSARSDDNEFNIITSNTIVKKLTGPFVAGTLQNGIDSGNRAASTTYHVHEITDGTNVDTLFSTSATSPTLPSGYVAARRIFSFKTNSTGYIPNYIQHGDKVILKTSINEYSSDPVDGSQQTITLSVPTGIRVIADTKWLAFNTTNLAIAAVVAGDCVAFDPTSDWALRSLYEMQNVGGMCELQLLTNLNGQVNYFCSATYALSSLIINTIGWIDTRGRDN